MSNFGKIKMAELLMFCRCFSKYGIAVRLGRKVIKIFSQKETKRSSFSNFNVFVKQEVGIGLNVMS